MEFGQPQTSGFLEPPMGFGQPEFYRNTVGDIRVPFKGSIRVPLRRSFKGSIGIMVYSLFWVMQDLYHQT